MEGSSIRINASMVKSHQGKVVRIIGVCESFDPSSSTATLVSGGPVRLSLTTGETLAVNNNYEIIGKVSLSDEVISVYSVVELSGSLNLTNADKMVSYVHKVPELFH